ncbi:15188_t:CDS:2, partial [Dentiscutata erythropus]
ISARTNNKGWTIHQPRRRTTSRRTGHIAVHCQLQAPCRETCRNCQSPEHFYRQCLYNTCYKCNSLGHIAVDCPLASLKYKNQTFQYGCDSNEVETQRQYFHSNRRTHYCCSCKNPQRPEALK